MDTIINAKFLGSFTPLGKLPVDAIQDLPEDLLAFQYCDNCGILCRLNLPEHLGAILWLVHKKGGPEIKPEQFNPRKQYILTHGCGFCLDDRTLNFEIVNVD